MLPSLIFRQQYQCSSSKRGGLSNLGPGDFKGVASFLVGNIKSQKDKFIQVLGFSLVESRFSSFSKSVFLIIA